ncbi:MAG: glycosyltransferase family 2 protein [Candidatus Shapirobacteria bacterium]|nr:glycosyltransferase family 2 protein [Candidatus Shapirobacteria bacterium]
MLSVVILAKNEEQNLPKCLESIHGLAGEIIIIDDNSTDQTLEIARKYKTKIFIHPLNNDFAAQRNFGLEKAEGDWILFVDADERISPELKKEIEKLIKELKFNGFYLRREDFFGGRFLKYGETANVRLLRLGRKGKGDWQRKVHEVWRISGPTGELKNPLLHYPHPTITEFLKNINRYSTLHAEALKKDGVKPSLGQIIFYPLGKFIQNYFFKLGFLDSTPGVVVALMMSFHSFLSRAKLFFLYQKDL